MKHLELNANKAGRDFFVGDIHGRFDLVEAAMKTVNFDPHADRIIAVGDLVDRGPYSDQVLDWLARPYFFSVLGNHETSWLHYLQENNPAPRHGFANEYQWFYAMRATDKRTLKQALEQLPFAITVGNVGVCHANTPRGMSWQKIIEELSDPDIVEVITWDYVEDYSDVRPIEGIEYAIHGHTIFPQPTKIGQHLYIDTGAFFSNRLTFATLPDLLRTQTV